MVGYCAVCKTERRPELMFHSFPKDEELRQKWIQNLGIKRKIYTSSRLCSIHFSQDCFQPALVSGKPMLKKGAIPTIMSLEEFIKKETVDEDSCENSNTENESQALDNENTVPKNSAIEFIEMNEEIQEDGFHSAEGGEYVEFDRDGMNCNTEDDEKMMQELQYSCRKISVKKVSEEEFLKLPDVLKGMYWSEAQHLIDKQAREIKSLQLRSHRYKKRIENLTIFTKSMKAEIKKRAREAEIE